MMAQYQRILYLQRPISKRHPMAVERRAKQFAPFAALKGFEETIREKEYIYEKKRDLPEEKNNDLDMKLKILKPGMEIRAEYFEENEKRPGYGQYHTVRGRVDFYDPAVYFSIGNVEINIHNLYDLSGDNFEVLELPC
ncbi:hypothetical protein K280104A7_32760 [Candidatus Bariatricus faecipullorum]